MTEEEKKVLWEFLKSIRNNVNTLIEEKDNDAKEQQDKYTELMLAISSLTTQFKLLIDELNKTNRIIKKEHHNTQDIVSHTVQQIQETVEGKTRIIVKEVSDKTKLWYQFWKPAKKEKAVNQENEQIKE